MPLSAVPPRRLPSLLLLVPCALLLAALAACAPQRAPVTHDVYVWQRAWRAPLRDALVSAADLTHAWRVLGAEADAAGRLRPVAIDPAMLAATHRPVVLVVRIDGGLAGLDGTALIRAIVALRARWQSLGLEPSAVEIDHDCGTARLAAYATWLAGLREALGPTARVSITALPAWLESGALDPVLAQADESVLQVHAVRQPRAGLFDAAQARLWTQAWARRTSRPFRVAVPTYGTRVSFDAAGNLSGIESETPLPGDAEDRRELSVSPSAVARFVAALDADPPAHWTGWAWFRLPTADDARAWRLSTWRAVVQGRSLAAPATLAWQHTDAADVYDLLLVNPADVDTDLPARIDLPAHCLAADGANGFELAPPGAAPPALALRPTDTRLLAPRARRIVGWARCSLPPTPLLASPDAPSR